MLLPKLILQLLKPALVFVLENFFILFLFLLLCIHERSFLLLTGQLLLRFFFEEPFDLLVDVLGNCLVLTLDLGRRFVLEAFQHILVAVEGRCDLLSLLRKLYIPILF